MNSIRKSKTAKRHFNFFDTALVALLIFCSVGVWQRENLRYYLSSDRVLSDYTVTFEAKKVRQETAALLQPETTVYLTQGDKTYTVGTVSTVLAKAAETELPDGEGETVLAIYPQSDACSFKDLSGTLEGRGVLKSDTFLLEGKTKLAVNQILTVHTEKLDIEIRITGIFPQEK